MKTAAPMAALPPLAADVAELDGEVEPGARIVAAAVPELPIVCGLAGPGLLADSSVKCWDAHDRSTGWSGSTI